MATTDDKTTDWEDWEEPPEWDLEDCLDCDNPFCSSGRCIKQMQAQHRRSEAMRKEVDP